MEADELVARILQLESTRLLAMAAAAREGVSAAPRVQRVDEAVDATLASLDELGVAYPGHAIARRYELSGPEYAVMQLALMPHHASEDLASLLRILGDPHAERPRFRHALELLAAPEERAALQDTLERGALLREELVRLGGEAGSELHVHPIVLELYGLG